MPLVVGTAHCLLFASVIVVTVKKSHGFHIAPYNEKPPPSLPLKCLLTQLSNHECDGPDSIPLIEDEAFLSSLEDSLVYMKRFMDDDDFVSRILQQHNDTSTRVQVKPSSLPKAGLGLFAVQDVPCGSLVSFYPFHGIGMDLPGGTITEKNVAMAALDANDQKYFQNEEESGRNNYRQYLLGNRPLMRYDNKSVLQSLNLFVSVNPRRFSYNNESDSANRNWLSHIINDGSVVRDGTEQAVLDYYEESRRRQNCLQIPFGNVAPLIATITNRDVTAGEELFTCYGSSYWLKSLLSSESQDEVAPQQIPKTTAIQSQIQQSAVDLKTSIGRAQKLYTKEWIAAGNYFCD